ncbi:DNA repair helicase [Planctomycetota bacterium]|nr:DNA repair helicase [Planctomycetota bacterium]
MSTAVVLRFAEGTLTLEHLDESGAQLLDGLVVRDPRVGLHRAAAMRYAEILRRLHGVVPYRDEARIYRELALVEREALTMRDYQKDAVSAWVAARKRGVVVLPTGTGKSYVALHCLLAAQRSALILAPTIDLVQQWAADLGRRLAVPIGQYGGGEKRLEDITVATYDSAVLFMPFHGNRFGLLICDECHHLPAAVTAAAAEQCLAPFRLGLTATPERLDGQHARLADLLGSEVHRSSITEMEGRFLSNYQVEVLQVAMDPDEAVAYADHRRAYLAFARLSGVNWSAADGWAQFLAAASRDPQGRVALRCYHEQRRLARASRAKLRVLWDLLRQHAGLRTIIFTDDNDTAYTIGREAVLPVLTHHTKGSERKRMLAEFRSGTLPVLVTSKVLNEGVDVPEAAVGIIVSGSGSVREHVQRLGRILRPMAGKTAVLYELLSAGTAEAYTSERRRAHAAFSETIE